LLSSLPGPLLCPRQASRPSREACRRTLTERYAGG
jgi:hypothetical protein